MNSKLSELYANEEYNTIHMYLYLKCLQGLQRKMLCNARWIMNELRLYQDHNKESK
jgi:hypothetical protein